MKNKISYGHFTSIRQLLLTAFVIVLYCYSGDYVQQGLLSKHFLWTFYKYKAAFIDSFCNSIVLLLWRLCTIWASFKTLVSKEAVTWQLEKFQSTDKLL